MAVSPSEGAQILSPLPDKPYRDFNLTEAGGAVLHAQHPLAQVNQQFIDGDHWQGGNGWRGPHPAPSEMTKGGAEMWLEIQQGFTSRNVILEVSKRHSTGVVGREPAWSLAVQRSLGEDEEPTAAEKKLIDEAEAPLTNWWNKKGIHKLLQRAATLVLHQQRAVLRIFIPEGLLKVQKGRDEQGNETLTRVATAANLETALGMIHVDCPHPKTSVVLKDPRTMEDVSILHVSNGRETYADVGYVKDPQAEKPVTVIRRMTTGNTNPQDYEFQLGGRLLMFQIERDLMITQQVQEQQRALNLAESMIPRNVVTSGFLALIITNGRMPGRFVDDEESPTGKRFVPDPFYQGAGTTNFINGLTTEDRDGGESITTPGVNYREPIPPVASIAARDAHYESILHEVDQAHHLMADDATASAASRIEARKDFLSSLKETKEPIERLGRWLIESVLALSEAIIEKPGTYTELLRADFNVRLQLASLTSEEQKVLAEQVEKGLIDKETAMSLLGVDDVDVALAKINAQPGSLLEMRMKQAEVVAAWIAAGVTIDVAAQLAGIEKDSDEYKLLAAQDPTKGQVTQQ